MGMKNDLSFLIDDRLSLYEHQSTVNPNMPLRFLFYISDLYSGMTTEENFYGRKALSIPIPCFVIFYNGSEPQPDRKILRLSDLYTVRMKETQLELTAVFAEHQPESQPGVDGSLPGPEGLCRICRSGAEIRQRTALVRGSGTCHHRVYPGRGS